MRDRKEQERWEKRKRKDAKRKRERMSEFEKSLLRTTGCEGKVRHATGQEASRQASRLLQNRGYRLVPYCCVTCGHWHLGRDSRKPRPDEPITEIPVTDGTESKEG